MTETRMATKCPKAVLTPLFDGCDARWQSHHITNPTVLRPSFDTRVYLGYRAGGDRDHYCIGDNDVFSSSLGLAILDSRGELVEARLALPIMRLTRTVPLPQSDTEYDHYVRDHADDICALHDFRLFEFEEHIYCIYHDGSITKAFDCVKRMPSAGFQGRVERSLELMERPVGEIRAEWERLWSIDEAWENAGVDGTRLVYPGPAMKNDITFYPLTSGELEMNHRPLPDIGRFTTRDGLVSHLTFDGFPEMGTLEACVRPGRYDNSHIGGNGLPTLAHIGDVPVYIDVCHGVHNGHFCGDEEPFDWDMYYVPYFRVKDAASGDLLYYSEDPILAVDETWREWVEEGRWIRALKHKAIVFAGGQTPVIAGCDNLDDEFCTFLGAGDTAIVRATFTLRNLLPEEVIADILVREEHRGIAVEMPAHQLDLQEKPSGWSWAVHNNVQKRCLAVSRTLTTATGSETVEKQYLRRPGYFDADAMVFDGSSGGSVQFLDGLGYAIVYRGIRWGNGQTHVGHGIILTDKDNLERGLYRSPGPVGETFVQDGYTLGEGIPVPPGLMSDLGSHIPERVKHELRRIYKYVDEGVHWGSVHTRWLRERAELQGMIL